MNAFSSVNAMIYLFVIISSILNIVYGGYPISDPNAANIGGKIQPYNLIDTDPSCFHQGICPMFAPGGKLSAFPNSEEKFQQMLNNLHRMHANQSLGTPLGHWAYGGNELGGETFFCKQGCVYCGTTHPNRRPLYWYSDANQMARFKQWDENTCDQSWYNQPGENAHSTCKWANTSLPSWRGFTNGILSMTYQSQTYLTGTNRCALFGANTNPTSSPTNPAPYSDDCEFSGRAGKFCHDTKDRCWFETEGICGGNTCLADPHCEPIFANKYDYVGKGFVENMNGVGHVYSRYTKEIYYPLPIGVHYDQRWKIHPNDRAVSTGKYFVLMLEYFDYNKTQTPSNCYALYDDTYTDMNILVSNHPYDGGTYQPGFYDNQDYSVIFKSNYLPPTTCKPYAFICKTSLGNFLRLPEENDYYFATEWMEWVWSDFENDYGYTCKENHYYNHPQEGWTVNGGPTLTQSDIWYYQDSINYGSCIGCQYISILDCWEQCIRSDFQSSQCQCSGSPTTPTTNAPTTKAPTSKAPTSKAPTTKSPTTTAPTSKAPTTGAPTTKAPTTKSPTTKTPTTKTPTTQSPTTKSPTTTTKAPTTKSPTTKAPTTNSPTTKSPTTKSPTTTTSAPTTKAPTTTSPTTKAPTTLAPTTLAPTTLDPTTKSPTTKAPTTKSPTTKEPTTKEPTTKEPTTKEPTTKEPTTKEPTTKEPTTKEPTTRSPTTKAPTTKDPTNNPTQNPTLKPTENPVPPGSPTHSPTDATNGPTNVPTTTEPSKAPSKTPTDQPSVPPTLQPSISPTNAPTTKAPTTKSPTTKVPTTNSPTTKAPTTNTPTTKAPTSTSPVTKAPTTKAPTTQTPTTKSPTTQAPTTKSPTTKAPTSGTPITSTPTTTAPTTASTTNAPTTTSPTTASPTTKAPTTSTPTTTSPTTASPTTPDPTSTTEAPTTKSPTTMAPTTQSPTTQSPTTQSPTTKAPTTGTPTTNAPTTKSPTTITTIPGETCTSIIGWTYRWSRIGSWNENTMGPTYAAVAEDLFDLDYPICGIHGTVEYYYYFEWGGLRRPNKKKLDIWLQVCCGDGMTFGQSYAIPDNVENNNLYQPNQVITDKYGNQGLEENESWIKPNKFGIKQYIVLGIIVLIILCCGCGCIYCVRYSYKKKKSRVGFEGDTADYLSQFPSKSRGSKKNLANTIQMHGMSRPGPKHIALPSYGADSTDGSTDGANKYQGQFIHAKQNNSDSQDGFTTNLRPPMALMGHAIMPSQSVDDTPELNAVANNMELEAPPTFSGLPPPVNDDDDDDDDDDDNNDHHEHELNQLNVEDIHNAFQ